MDEAREVALWLRACTVPEDTSFFPSTHIGLLTTPVTPGQEDITPFSGLHGYWTHRHTPINQIILHKNK